LLVIDPELSLATCGQAPPPQVRVLVTLARCARSDGHTLSGAGFTSGKPWAAVEFLLAPTLA
jgi:hypothetical protein